MQEKKLPESGKSWQGKKKLLAVIAILAACAVGFILMPMANKQSTEQVAVVQAADIIAENTVITEDMLKIVMIPAKLLPENAVQSVEVAVGQYAQQRIEKQDYLTTIKIGEKPAVREVNATPDKRIISMTVPTAAAGVSGMLEVGDLVSVWSVPKDTGNSLFNQSTLYTSLGTEAEPTAEPSAEAEKAPSAETAEEPTETEQDTEQETEQNGQNPADIAPEAPLAPENILTEPEATLHEGLEFVEVAGIYSATEANAEHVGADIPVTISLYVTKEQAEILVEVEHFENLHFVFAARGENRAKYMNKEDIIVW